MTQSSVWTALRARTADADVKSAGDAVPDHAPDAAAAGALELPEPEGWSDPLTGTDGPKFWERVVATEEARRVRYGRPMTVAIVDLTGFTSDGSWLGRERVLQIFDRLAYVLGKQVRTSDYTARIGPTRFGILLFEADEINAINFIDRVRTAVRNELGTESGFGVRTGWASPGETETLEAAVERASARLDDPAFQGAA